jgi:hypothetical protein
MMLSSCIFISRIWIKNVFCPLVYVLHSILIMWYEKGFQSPKPSHASPVLTSLRCFFDFIMRFAVSEDST